MKSLIIMVLLVTTLVFSQSANAGTAFLVSSYVSGLNKICVYNYLGSDVAMTIDSYEICPATIEV